MSVNGTSKDLDQELAALEAETVKELETKPEGDKPTDKPDDQDGAKPEGESATPEPESTTGKETTDVKPDGEDKPKDGTKPDGSVEGDDSQKPEGEDKGKRQPSERAQSRQQELANKLKESELARKALARELELAKTQGKDRVPAKPKSNLPWDDKDGEVTIEDYKADVETKAREVVQEEFKVKELQSNVNSDIQRLESDYPELRPVNLENGQEVDNPDYDQELVDWISENYKVRLKENRELRLYDYAKKIMDKIRARAQAEAEKAKAESQKNIQKNLATQPIVAGSQTTKTGTVEDAMAGAKTIEELDAIAAKNLPIAST